MYDRYTSPMWPFEASFYANFHFPWWSISKSDVQLAIGLLLDPSSVCTYVISPQCHGCHGCRRGSWFCTRYENENLYFLLSDPRSSMYGMNCRLCMGWTVENLSQWHHGHQSFHPHQQDGFSSQLDMKNGLNLTPGLSVPRLFHNKNASHTRN